MDQNVPVMAKKFWKIVRVAFFMLRKGLSKRKLMFDLNLLMKRGKIAGKAAIQNLMFHHNNNTCPSSTSSSKEYYEFSCSNSPAFHLPFNLNKRSKHNRHHETDGDVLMVNAAVLKALEMIQSETASPALPGFGRTPTVRQLRVTDSPFPIRDGEGNSHVDEKADEFISRFYRDLRREASAFA
nr:uncharacterized protein LOC104113450 [Nicotiana tomentosiformis]